MTSKPEPLRALILRRGSWTPRALILAVLLAALSLWGCSSSESGQEASSDLGSTETLGDIGTTELGFADAADEVAAEPGAESAPEAQTEISELLPEVVPEPIPEVLEEPTPEPPPEVVSETSVEIIAGSAKAYLVTSLSVETPELCMPSGTTCVPMNGLLSAYFQSAIDDPEDPLLVMALFEDFLDDSAAQAMRFGNASCDWDDDLAQSCAFDLSDPKNVADLSVNYVLSGACGEGLSGPCFQTDAQQVFLAFPLFETHFGLLAAALRGGFQGIGLAELAPGEIRGFLPQSLAQKYQVSGVGAEPVLVSDLFVDAPVSVNGVEGWWMSLSVTGRAIDYAE